MRLAYTAALLLTTSLALRAADAVDDLIQQARAALMKGQADQALTLLGKAIETDAKNKPARLIRSLVFEGTGKYAEALADLNKVLEIDPASAEAFDRRGSVHFKMGKFHDGQSWISDVPG